MKSVADKDVLPGWGMQLDEHLGSGLGNSKFW